MKLSNPGGDAVVSQMGPKKICPIDAYGSSSLHIEAATAEQHNAARVMSFKSCPSPISGAQQNLHFHLPASSMFT